MKDDGMGKPVKILIASFLGAVILAIFGDILVYEAEEGGYGFEEGSNGAELVNVAPLLIIALGFYGAYANMDME